jgi:chromosome segregation ATPase
MKNRFTIIQQTVVAAALLFAAFPAKALTFDDIKSAASMRGVNSIPFPELRSKAAAIAGEVDRSKEAMNINTNTLKNQLDNLVKQCDNVRAKMAEKEKEIGALKQKYKEVNVSSQESDIRSLRTDLVRAQTAVADFDTQKVMPAIEQCRRLSNARGALREMFDDALAGLREIENSPERVFGRPPSDSERQQLLAYIHTIRVGFESEEGQHRWQEDQAKKKEAELRGLFSKR